MAASEIEQWWIDKFQENLGPIRKVAGWTTQQLADELGVARQTVSNLETGKSPMTKLQYLALRTVFSAEIARREDRDWHASSRLWSTIPLSNAFANGALKSRTARPLPTMPQSIRTVATLPTTPPPRNASPVPPH